MSRKVRIQVKVGEHLRYHFQLAAWRSHQSPSHLLRKLMAGYVSFEANPKVIDLTVESNSRWNCKHMDVPKLP
jgi:hypothetical protein